MSESDLSLKSLDYEVISNSCKEKYGVLWGQLFSRHIGFPLAEILILPLFVEERCLSFQPNFRWCYRLGIQIAISQIKFWPRLRHFNPLLCYKGNPKVLHFFPPACFQVISAFYMQQPMESWQVANSFSQCGQMIDSWADTNTTFHLKNGKKFQWMGWCGKCICTFFYISGGEVCPKY